MSDARRDYLVTTVTDVVGKGAADAIRSALTNSAAAKAVDAFADGDTLVLSVTVTRAADGKDVTVSATNDVAAGSGKRGGGGDGKQQAPAGASGAAAAATVHAVHFLKKERGALPADGVAQAVLVCTGVDSPLNSLYLFVHNLFMPQLREDDQLSQSLQKSLFELDDGLHTALIRRGTGQLTGVSATNAGGAGSAVAGTERDVSGIRSLSDELYYWDSEAKGAGGGGHAAARANVFRTALKKVAAKFDAPLRDIAFRDMQRLIEDVQDAFNDMYKDSSVKQYPQERMANNFELISGVLLRYLRERVLPDTLRDAQALAAKADAKDDAAKPADVKAADAKDAKGAVAAAAGGAAAGGAAAAAVNLDAPFLWFDKLSKVRVHVDSASALCRRWLNVIKELQRDWRDRWQGAKYTDERFETLGKRLNSVKAARELQDELTRLLSKDEQNRFGGIERLSAPFHALDVLQCGPFTLPKWEAAFKEFGRSLQPIEQHAASLLKARIFAVTDRPALLIGEFNNFARLLLRPTVATALAAERETLAGTLLAYVEDQRSKFETASGAITKNVAALRARGIAAGAPAGKNLSETLRGLVYAKQEEGKLAQTTAVVSKVLAGVNGIQAFDKSASDLLRSVQEFAKGLFDSWSTDMLEAVQDRKSGIMPEPGREIMKLDMSAGGELKVQFSDRLVALIREVRHISELGFAVPPEILKAVELGDKFYRYALKLKQVANFYNTMAEQILPSQLGMLENEARAFESVVRSQAPTFGNNPDACEPFVRRLSEAADALTSRNRKLRAVHLAVHNSVAALLDLSLYRQKDQWLDAVARINALFVKEAQTYSAGAIKNWKKHWEHQLYRVFEFQYRMCIESLNDSANEITLKLEFKNRKLVTQPSLEELRSKYYKTVKKFLDLPKTFRGLEHGSKEAVAQDAKRAKDGRGAAAPLTDVQQLYMNLAERNADSIYNVYASAEQMFAQLAQLVRDHQQWVALGCVDIDEFTEQRLVDVGDWKTNFKALKQRRKEMERLPDTRVIGCFRVNFAPFKQTVENHMRSLSDALLVSLRKSALNDLRLVDEYLKNGTARLQSRPRTIEEMSAAKKEAKIIGDQKNEMRRIRDRVGLKNELLRETTAGSIEALDLSGLKPRWESFNDLLGVFDDILNEQRSTLVQDIEKKIKDCKLSADKFKARWQGLRPRVEQGQIITRDAANKIVAGIDDRVHELKQLQDQAKDIITNAEQFELRPLPTFEVLEEVQKEINTEQQSWALVGDYSQQLGAMLAEPWVEFRAHLGTLNEHLHSWTEKLKGRPRDVVYDYLTNDMAQYKQLKDVLKYVTGDVFEPEHWRILFGKLKFPSDVTLAKLTLGHFVQHQRALLENQKELQALAARAQGEIAIRLAVNELKIWAEQTEFALLEQKVNGKTVWLIKEWKELFTKVSDQQTVVSSLQDTPYFAPFADQCLQLQAKLVLLDEVLHSLNSVQRKWVYLAPIFGRGALPSEQPRFKRIDADFRGIMEEIKTNPNVVNLASVQGLKDTVNGLADQLDRCQKALNDFLEEKRSKFPRFYFIGDDDLLEILGQSQNPAVINNHLKKLFAGIHTVDFSGDKKQIVAMKSSDKEVVPLATPVAITEDVEDWLDTLAKGMEKTLADSLVACCRDKAPDYDKYSSQILCLAEMIRFTANVEAAIRSNAPDAALKRLLDELNAQLKALTGIDVSDDTLRQLKVQALVLDLIHNIEVVRLLIANRVTALDDWNWHKQLRYYLNVEGGASASAAKRGSGDAKQLVGGERCTIRMCDATFKYTYEYQGNAPKLVHTPLTDKCYLVLTQGMHLGYGGNPYGPAGTGKTESVKALGQAFGRQVLVFNCDEGIDFQSMGRIFTGIVKSGAWGCFDEFNRLKEDQLSAVSQQIQVIQAALKKGDPTCELLARPVNVNSNAAIFVTLNPASKDYGGRSKLPHNLKQLFRSVAMSAPDFRLIAEVLLYAEGFQHARELGHKIVEIYALSLQLLSPQRHYDWGLRALKTVLHHSGQLIHAEKAAQRKLDIAAETKLLVGALRINTMSKLTYADSVRFNALIQDVFPGLVVEEIDYKRLETEIRAAMRHYNMEQVDTQIKKILQLYEALNQRMGVVIVGPSGCGKSVMLQVLREAQKRMGKEIVQHVMNPKALHREKLLGHMDHDTRLWSDGVLTASARAVQASAQGVHSWITCDGDVDPEWIESLNSVLDDNHLLTMPNGERIKFGDNVNFIFESHDLQFASPATVSRMGMIFLSEEDVDVKSLVTSWVNRQTPAASEQQQQGNTTAAGASAGADVKGDGKEVKAAEAKAVSSGPVYDERKKNEDRKMREKYVQWMDDLFYRALNWVLDSNALVVPTTKVGIVQSALSHLVGVTQKGEFAVGLIRGMGANLDLKQRTTFAKEVLSWSAQRAPDSNYPLDCYWNSNSGSLQPYVHQDLGLVKADQLLTSSPPLINTVGMQRNRAIIDPWLRNMQPFIVVGPEGCGKTLLLTSAFRSVKGASVATIHCSAQTDATHVMQRLSEACNTFSTNKGRVLRPKEGDRLILFLKDLNLPRPDKYATIQLIAFLQQLITYKGFYDENLDWLGIERVHIVGSMNPATTVGRSQLSTRFTAIVNVMYMSYPDHDALHAVYSSFLKSVLSIGGAARADDRWKTDGNVRKLAASMVDIYEKIRAKFSVDDYRHYLFNPRDLTEWCFGLLRYELGPPIVPGGGVSTVSVQPLFEPWGYECYRLFCDRLVDRDAIRKFEAILTSTLRAEWKYELKLTDVYYSSLNSLAVAVAGSGGGKDAKDKDGGKDTKGGGGTGKGASAGRGAAAAAPETKGDADAKTPSELGPTLERMTSADFKDRLSDALRRYEDEHKNLRMLLFPEILDHLAFEDRVLSRPGGSILLIGDSGVGRRSSVALLSYMHGLEFFSPNMTKNYGVKSFRQDLKDLMRATGVEARRVVLYIEDHQIVDNAFLEDLNSLLAAGEVPGLFGGAQELDMMLTPLKEEFAAVQGASEQRRYRNLFEFFTSRVRVNLHVVLSMNSAHPQFAMRCESNPAIYNRCTILWMSRWTAEGMKQVQNARLQPILTNPQLRINPSAIQDAVLYIHNSCLSKGATPTKYVAFLDTYLALYKQQLDKETTAKKHLDAGLDKLAGAAKTVEVLTKEATVKKELVARKQKEADNALDVITDRMAKASESRKEADEFRARASEDEKKQVVKKKSIESELKEIQPILDNARTAVGSIQKDNLTEIRALRMPPPPIRNVLAGVLMLMKQDDVTWQAMRNHLAKPMFKEEIIHFDAKNIDKATRMKVTQMVKENAESFDPANIMRVNRAAAPLAQWVTANLKYSAVLESIAPLMNELDKATAALVAARNRADQCEKQVTALDAEVKELKVSFSAMNREATRLKDDLEKTAQTLEVASSLLGKLSGEKKRWDEQSKNVGVSLEALPFNAMLAAAVINFLGASPEDVRAQTLNDWKAFCKLKEFDFMSFLATESQQLLWKKQGLPSDTLSVQNAIVILNSVQCPYVIDPNGQAAAFLRKNLESKTLDVIMQQDPKFVTLLETAVRFGRTLIVLEADRVLPIVYPLLRRDLFKKGGRVFVQVGDKEYDYNDQFRLFMVTRNTDPDITADAAALITTVNFTVTRSGLEGQLLALTLEAERPELEKTKSKLLAEEDSYRVELADLEKSLLQELAMSEGNILENKALIASLDKTKSQSSHIGEMLRSAKQVAANLDVQRDVYRPIAKTGSLLFFLIAQLNAVNNMYEFSLPTFIRLFNDNLRVNARKDAKQAPMSPTNAAQAAEMSAKEPTAAEKKATEEHIQRIRESLKLAVLYYVSRSLFKADRFMYGLHMIHCLQPHLFQPKEWEFFTGELVLEDAGGESKAAASAGGGLPAWATKDRASAYSGLASTFPGLVQRLDLHDHSMWGAWAKNARCEQEFPPVAMKNGDNNKGGVTPFQRLLLVQTLRPDRLQSAIQLYVCETLGVKSLAPPQGFNLAKLVDETSPTEPILFVATAGADPSLELEEFAMKAVGKQAYVQIALGSGQTEGALIALRRCAEEGHWLCLKNLHLVTHWLGDFEKFFRALKPKPKFRLWLTTEPHPTFPSILLQQSLKVTYESPPGIKQNLLRTFESWDSAYFAQGSVVRAQILFVLAWFHAIVQERRTYIPQGFTKFYEFSFADLRSGADIIDAVCARITDKASNKLQTERLPWPTIWGLMEQAIYGGRIDVDHDIRVVVTYLHKFFNLAVLPTPAAAASAKLHVGLEMPISNKYDEYMKLIQSLPNTDAPGVFTLAPNVEGAVQQTQSSAVVSQLRKLAVSSQLSSKFDREMWRNKLSPLLNLWEKIAVKSDKGVLTRPPKSRYAEADMSPVDSFVTLENARAYEVVTMVADSLQALHSVVYGSGLLTTQIRDDALALLGQTVPNRWGKAWGGSEDPATFLREVVSRQQHLRRWLERVNTGATLSEPLPLALVFSSRTFLNALRQQTARAAKKPIDTLKLTVAWNPLLLPKSAVVKVEISGLLCQGVGFDVKSGLQPLTSDAPTLSLIPTATFAWIDKNDAEPYPDGLPVPCYFSPAREEFICEVRMPAKPPQDQWILSGAALFLADVK